jgi:ADP-ribosyl-[dinitrogen reductase] hydrolase
MSASADQVIGSLIGGAIGDAMGTAYEGRRGPLELDDNARWVISDDTQLTLATCEGIMEAGGPAPEAIARSMVGWFKSRRLSGLGASTLKALRDLAAGAHWALSGRKGEMAAGNGAAMRIAPVAFFLDPMNDKDRQTIRDISRITHHNDEAYAGALALVAALRCASSRAGLQNLIGDVRIMLPRTGVRARLEELAALAEATSITSIGLRFGSSGYVVESVPLAIYGAAKLDKEGYVGILRQLIAAGGDTDTVASMAGQIMGVRLGLSALPTSLVARLPDRELVLETAQRFAQGVTGARD